jgi:hypothetical protein
MKSHFRKLGIESLEGPSVLSATAIADFNNDGLMDMAAITDPNTVVVSLANPDGSFEISAILKTAKNEPITDLNVLDNDSDGDLDIMAVGSKRSGSYYFVSWQNNGDGIFDYVEPYKGRKLRWF